MRYKVLIQALPEEYSKVIYGDSVTGDTPLLLKKDEMIYIKTIEDIFGKAKPHNYPLFKMFDDSLRTEKEFSLSDYRIWSKSGWVNIKKVIRHKCNKRLYKVSTCCSSVNVTEDHSLLSSELEIIKPGDCSIGTELFTFFPEDIYKEKISPVAKIKIDLFLRKRDTFEFGSTNKIISIEPIGKTDDYVYDIETEDGTFQAGIGDIIVKNTDSCMIELNTKALVKYKNKLKEYEDILKLTPEEQKVFDYLKTKAIEEAFEHGKILADEVTKALFKSPINLEFEKVYSPFLIFSKKRYTGMYYGKDPYTIDFKESKGIVTKRRDNANIVKKIYNGVIDPLLEHGERGINISIDFLKTELGKLMNQETDLEDLVICKSLAKGYGKILNGILINSESDYTSNNLPHVALAIKMRERDLGSAPNVGDRISYVITETDNPKAKLYEKSESPEVVKEKNLKIDYLYYINNQIRNPIDEVLKILVSDSSKIFDDAIVEAMKVRNKEIEDAKFKAKNKLEKGQLSILHWIKPDKD